MVLVVERLCAVFSVSTVVWRAEDVIDCRFRIKCSSDPDIFLQDRQLGAA